MCNFSRHNLAGDAHTELAQAFSSNNCLRQAFEPALAAQTSSCLAYAWQVDWLRAPASHNPLMLERLHRTK